MRQLDAEDMYIRSLDATLREQEKVFLAEALRADPELENDLLAHAALRDQLRAKEPATFGPFFATRVVNAIGRSALAIDHYLLSLFQKFQLAAVGVAIGLLALNVVFADQLDVMSILGIQSSTNQEEDALVFDFFESINENL